MSVKISIAIALLLHAREVAAEPTFSGKIVLSGHYYVEQGIVDNTGQAALSQLAFGELRAQLGVAKLWQDRVALQLDFRLRLTGEFDFASKFEPAAMPPGDLIGRVSARGYLGGPEYEFRELAARLRASSRVAILLGRQVIRESEALKLDGARVVLKLGTHWEGSMFAGGYPNPYSRSLLTDYVAPCGDGVNRGLASATLPPDPTPITLAIGPCQPSSAIAVAAGITTKFNYDRAWGALGLAVTPFVDPRFAIAVSGAAVNSAAHDPPPDLASKPRIFLSWQGMYRFTEHLDLFSNLVWDLYGSQGMQLTRLVLLGSAHWLRDNRLTLHLGYSTMSSLAISGFLYNLLYSRQNGQLPTTGGIVENNLALLRTARHEGRGSVELKLVARLMTYIEARLRYRGLLDDGSSVFNPTPNSLVGDNASLAEDLAIGLRDGGSIRKIFFGLSYAFISDYRTRNHVINVNLERSFWSERLSFSLGYYLVLVSDAGSGQSCDPTQQPLSPGCFGQRSGATHEASVLFTLRPGKAFFFLIDYRFGFLHSAAPADSEFTDIISHTLLLHAEHRF